MQTDITQTTNTDLDTTIDDFEVGAMHLDSPSGTKETKYVNSDFTKWLGYYKTTSIKKPIDAYATWVLGKGFETALPKDRVILDNITGWGEDTFLSIMWNMLVTKKFNGDSYAEIIRNDDGLLINIKPLNAGNMANITNQQGIIIRYEYTLPTGKTQKFQPNEILHLVNDRVGDEIHGVSVCELAEWVILARKEAMTDWKRISHRSTIRVLYVDEDDKDRLDNLKRDYADGINKGELLILPVKKEEASFEDLQLPPVEAFLAWIRYLDGELFRVVGIPKNLVGDVEGITESGGKMAYLNHEPIYNREVTDLEADIFNQLAIKVTFNKQASLKDSVNDTENKSINQTQAEQPSDTQIK